MSSSSMVCFSPRVLARSVGVGLALIVTAFLVSPAGHAESQPGWLGVYIERPRADATVPGPTDHGATVSAVVADGPAAKAGLRARDRIKSVGSQPIFSFKELSDVVRDNSANGWIQLTVERNGEEFLLDARLTKQPDDPQHLEIRQGWIGAGGIDLPASLRVHFGATADTGVMIAEVEDGSPAFAAGLVIGDLVFEVDGAPLKNAAELVTRIKRGGVGNTVELGLIRAGVEILLEMTIEEAPRRQRQREDNP